ARSSSSPLVRLEAPVRVGGETRFRPLLAEHDVRRALITTLHADGVLNSIEPVHPRALDSRLNVVLREERAGGRRAVEVELRALPRGLNRQRLFCNQLLLLRSTPSDCGRH